MNAADPRIRATAIFERARSRRPDPGKTAIAAALLLPGLIMMLVGIASFSLGAAELVAGVLLVVAAVGYLRGSD